MSARHKRVALVTGANRGIGYEIARQLAKKGLLVIIGARDTEKGAQSGRKLVDDGLDVRSIRVDVTDGASITAAVGWIEDEFGRLDILVNNAGIMIDSGCDILDLPLTQLRNTLETNSFGLLLLSQTCIPVMRKNDYGRIVNIASILGSLSDIANPDSAHADLQSPAYRLSKSMVNGITALLARELQGKNILVNSVCPGWVRTDLGGPQAPVAPEEAAKTPVWLATLDETGPSGGFFRGSQPLCW
ncbi:MAG TPA: SDR family oxidoreductase [Desulfopila sp.]|nr:SDR family oxidoreductase [Desulfopila sp.]